MAERNASSASLESLKRDRRGDGSSPHFQAGRLHGEIGGALLVAILQKLALSIPDKIVSLLIAQR